MGRPVQFHRILLLVSVSCSVIACAPQILTDTLNKANLGSGNDVSHSTVVSYPLSVVADGSSQATLTVTLKDSSGAPLVGKSVILFSSRGTMDVISNSSGPTDSNGMTTFHVRSAISGSSVYTATDSTDKLNVTSSSAHVAFTPGFVIPSQTTIVATSPLVPADGITSSQIQVTLKDAQGNPVPGKSLTLTSSRGITDTITPQSGVSDASGSFIFSVTSVSAGVGIFSAVNSSDQMNLPPLAQVMFMAGSGSVTQSTVVASLTSVTADGVSTSTITVTLKDSNGNPVSGKAVALTSSRLANDTISLPSSLSNLSGVVTFTVKSSHAGTSVYSATDTTDSMTMTQTASVSYLAGTPSAAQSTLTANILTIADDGVATSTLTATLKDSSGNPVSGKAVTLSSNRGGSDTISAGSGTSNGSGVVTFTVSSTHAGSSTFTAFDTTDSITIAQTASVTFSLGAVSASVSTVSASPTSVLANGSATSTVTVTLKDAHSNPVSGKSVSLTSSRAAIDTISAPSGVSNASGVVTFTVVSSTAGSATFSAIETNENILIVQTAAVTFISGTVSATVSSISGTPTTVNADGVATSTVTVTLKDANSNPVPGKTVTLSSSRGGSDLVSAASGPSNASGVVTFTVKSTSSGTSTYTATDLTDSILITPTTSVTYSAAAVSVAQSTVTASPSSITADGSTSSTVSVTLKDSSGNPISGKTVTLSSSRGASDTISASSGASNASGIVTFTVKTTSAGSSTYTAFDATDSATITQTGSVNFTAGVVNASASTVTTSPSSVTADGSSTSTITVTLKDAHSNPVSGKTVTLSSNRGGTDTLSSASGASDSSGVVTFTVKATLAGNSTFTATDTTDSLVITQTGLVTFVAGAVSATLSSVTANVSSLYFTRPGIITVTLLDAFSNPVSGKSVTLSSNRSTRDWFSPSFVSSDASGVATFTVLTGNPGTSVYTAIDSSDSLTIIQTATISFGTFILDQLSTSATVGLSLRRLTSSATKAIQVTRSSDNATQDIGFAASGLIDQTSLLNFVTSNGALPFNSGYVNIWYNQASTPDFTQTTAANFPTIVSSGSVVKVNGMPAIRFNGVVAGNPNFVAGAVSNVGFVSVVLNRDAGNDGFLLGDLNSYNWHSLANQLFFSDYCGTSTCATGSIALVDGVSFSPAVSAPFSPQTTHVISVQTVANDASTSWSNIGSDRYGAHNFKGYYSEVVSFSNTPSTADQNTLYNSQQMLWQGLPHSTISAFPASIPADGSTTTLLKVILIDPSSHPLPGKTVSLTSSRGGIDTISPSSVVSDSNGQAIFTLSSNKIGQPTLYLTDSSDGTVLIRTVKPNLIAVAPQTDYQARTANLGALPGDNATPVSSWKEGSSPGLTNSGSLSNFNYTNASGWVGDGTLLSTGTFGPFRLILNGISNLVDFGASLNANLSFSFETWIMPASSSTGGSMILSTADASNRGFNLAQLSDGSGRVTLTPAGIASGYTQAVLADSPTIYWRLDETSGTTASDSSGNGNTGTYYTDSAPFTFSQPGLLLSSNRSTLFPGASNSHVYSNTSFYDPFPFSLEVWFKTTSMSGGALVGFSCAQTSFNGCADRNIAMTNGGDIVFTTYNGAWQNVDAGGVYNDGNLHHVVATASASGMVLYIDGVQVGANLSAVGDQVYTGYWHAGAQYNSPISSNSWNLNGIISEFAIYNTALSSARIRAHYLAGLQNCVSQTALLSNAWSHLAGVFNNSGNTATLYLNGNSQCTVPFYSSTFAVSSNDLTFGATPSLTNPWSGAIESLRTYASVLPSTAIQSNYAATAVQLDIKQLGAQAPLMWLKADSIQGLIDGALISTWLDSGPNGNNATQSTVANQPLYKVNMLNGYPIVRFDGSTSYMNGANVFPTNQDYTIISVEVPDNIHGQNNLLASSNNAHGFRINDGDILIYHQGTNSSAQSTLGFNSNHVAGITSVVYTDSNLQGAYYFNGASVGVTTASGSNAENSIQIGSSSNANFPFAGNLAEILLFGSALSNNDRSLVENYLNAKYAVY